MVTARQLLAHGSVGFTSFVLTVGLLYACSPTPPPPRMLLDTSTLVQIEVPLGLLPNLELENPAFGIENGRIAWIDEAHAPSVMTAYTGPQPEAWPEPQR